MARGEDYKSEELRGWEFMPVAEVPAKEVVLWEDVTVLAVEPHGVDEVVLPPEPTAHLEVCTERLRLGQGSGLRLESGAKWDRSGL